MLAFISQGTNHCSEQTEHHRLILSKRHSLSQDFGGTYAKLRNTFDWVQQVMRLCNQLNEGLWKTVDAYEGFFLKHASVFIDIPRSAIDKTFDELKGLRKTLESLADRCNQCNKEVCKPFPCCCAEWNHCLLKYAHPFH